jgi:hypothetical protein
MSASSQGICKDLQSYPEVEEWYESLDEVGKKKVANSLSPKPRIRNRKKDCGDLSWRVALFS